MHKFTSTQKIANLFFVIVLFVLYTMAVWDSSRRDTSIRERQSYNSHTYASQAEQKIENTCLTLNDTGKAKCIYDIIKTTNEHNRSERDLVAQTDMAFWAFWMAIISGLMFFATAVGVVFVYKTLSATREMVVETKNTTVTSEKSVEATRHFNKIQLRAYVDVEKISIERFTATEIFNLKYEVVNNGQTPARKLRSVSRIFIRNISDAESKKIHFPDINYSPTLSLGPKQRLYYNMPQSEEISLVDFQKIVDGTMIIIFAGVISYIDVFGVTRRTVFKTWVPPNLLDDDGCTMLAASSHHNSSS